MNIVLTTILVAILIFMFAFAAILRNWIRGIRQDIYHIRDEIRAIKKSNAVLATSISNMTAESVNASCINTIGFRFPIFMGGPSIDTHHARNLLFLLQHHKPRTILELGSGSSTIIIARALQLMGSPPEVHISVDHEARFLRNTEELARLNGVDELIRFEHCPLQKLEAFPKPWYSRIPELAGSFRFDFVLVDGPPAYAEDAGRTREPALPILRPYLAPNAVVILDDANRPGEQDIIKAWLKKYPEFQLHQANEGKGVAIFTLNAQ